MDPRISSAADIFRLNTRLFENCLQDLTDAQCAVRVAPSVNNILFIATHVTDTRFAIAHWIGSRIDNPLASIVGNARGLDDLLDLPSLSLVRAAWHDVSEVIAARLSRLTVSELDAPSPAQFPIGGPTLLGALAFLAQHDSYHIGQLALLRKAVGLPAMTYRTNTVIAR
jgi:hypothetical protein